MRMTARRRRGPSVGVVAAIALSFVAGGFAAESQQIDVQAKVAFVKRGIQFSKLRLEIRREDTVWRSGPLGSAYILRPQTHIRDLDLDGEPEVWVDIYSGGAHCCLDSRFFRWQPSRAAYASTKHAWRDIGYERKRLDGDARPELVSADARFGYMFTAFAGSAFPIQIWHFDHGQVVDVTRNFPSQIERDADQLWRSYLRFRRGPDDPRGVLAAWVADQYLLGRGDEGWATILRIAKRGELGPRADLAGWPQGGAYLKALRSFLKKTGYVD
jgi:hypothetical protein